MGKLLSGKKILFIAPVFYGYEDKIASEISYRGGDVLFFPERHYNWGYRIFNNFCKFFLNIYQKQHYNTILKKTENEKKIDLLFVIRGCQMPREFPDILKKRYPEIKTIMYQWDSEKSNQYIHLRDLFDEIYTFDFDDARTFHLQYLPLFYTKDIETVASRNIIDQYDYFFLSSYNWERYEYLRKLLIQLSNVRFYHYLHIPFSTYIKERLKGYKFDKDLLKFEPMSREQYIQKLMETRVIIDISPSIQSGLPMRIIEALGARKKIVTTNVNISKEFGDSRTMRLISDNFDFQKYANEKCDIYPDEIKKYSLDEWISTIFA